MRKKSLTKEFIQLSKYDLVIVATIKLKTKKDAKTIVRRIDSLSPNFTDVFFAFEPLEPTLSNGLKEDCGGDYEVVMAYHPKQTYFIHLFQTIPKCTLIQVMPTSIAELYSRLASATFKVDHELLFHRLTPKDSFPFGVANPLARMLIEQDVLSLLDLSSEQPVLEYLSEYLRIYRRKQGQRSKFAKERQRLLQEYLYGQYEKTTQIHLPRQEVEPIFEMLQAQQRKEMDYQSPEIMDCEVELVHQPEQLAVMMRELRVCHS